MKISQRLIVAATCMLVGVFSGTSAQAVSSINCYPWSLPGNTGLGYKVCATGGADTLDGTAWVTNKSNTTQYVQYIVMTNSLGGYLEVCQINAWLAPGVTKPCTLFTYAPNTQPNTYFVWGKISYWSPTQSKYMTYEGYAAPTYVW